ncbi:hypothetical protein Dvina_19215 [Dactylosporangium vinaceum]|uniref:Uncharacterized protein n=1 Tax=Dactylosporangium vinaceum TaxID=53362 RepID=A0ABV5M9E2_9ACTN|nr:hypothetical protein [Dactylosporangium vinaceum]UAB99993.1 hypothetical protein Dvina_19215 [Dactylosporangium vinaceum]
MCTLDAAAALTSTPCQLNELGDSIGPACDAIQLAAEIVRPEVKPAELRTGPGLRLDGDRPDGVDDPAGTALQPYPGVCGSAPAL